MNCAKKFALIFAGCLLAFCLVGCAPNQAEQNYEDDAPSRFTIIERSDCWYVVKDNETNVMYAVSAGGRNYGTFTLLVDENGDPLLYEEGEE